MPNWADDEGRFWWVRPGSECYYRIEVPHPPITVRSGCKCEFCVYERKKRKKRKKRKDARL